MFKTILVPLDGSELAERALPYAAFLTRAVGGSLTLLHAATSRSLDRDLNAEVDAMLELERRAEQLTLEGVSASARTLEGAPGPAIVRAVTNLGADLIVMSTHGRGGVGRVVHGSTADYVLHHVSVPILAVAPKSDRAWLPGRPLRILIPLDGSAFAEEALAPSLELAQELPAEFWLLRSVEERVGIDALGFAYTEPASQADVELAQRYLEQTAAPLRQQGHTVTVTVEAGRPDDAMERLVDRESLDLVVMATHGQGGLGRLLLERMATVVTAGRIPLHLGSVTASTLRRLSAPVLLVCPSDVSHGSGQASTVGTGA